MEFEIRLRSVQDILDFVGLATSRKFPISVGNARNRVNAKSFMEMFCLNLKKPVTVRLECSEEEYRMFCQDADRYVVK